MTLRSTKSLSEKGSDPLEGQTPFRTGTASIVVEFSFLLNDPRIHFTNA
jgi:hypothetical protein